jgi:hypothetical protein
MRDTATRCRILIIANYFCNPKEVIIVCASGNEGYDMVSYLRTYTKEKTNSWLVDRLEIWDKTNVSH